MEQKDLLRFWTHMNKLSIQVSTMKEEFARMINDDDGKTKEVAVKDNSKFLIKPCR